MLIVGYGNPSEIAKKFSDEAKLREDLEKIRDEFPAAISAELDAIIEKVVQRAKELCPVESHALQNSINSEGGAISESRGGDFYEKTVYAGDEINRNYQGVPSSQYALLVEEGHVLRDGKTMYMGAHMLSTAMMEYEAEVENAVSRALASMDVAQ